MPGRSAKAWATPTVPATRNPRSSSRRPAGVAWRSWVAWRAGPATRPWAGRRDSSRPDRGDDAADDPGPSVAIEDDEGQRGRHVEPDEQGQEVRLRRGLRRDHPAPPEELGEDHRMAEARDGEELGDALEQPEHDRLEVGQHGASLPDRVRLTEQGCAQR